MNAESVPGRGGGDERRSFFSLLCVCVCLYIRTYLHIASLPITHDGMPHPCAPLLHKPHRCELISLLLGGGDGGGNLRFVYLRGGEGKGEDTVFVGAEGDCALFLRCVYVCVCVFVGIILSLAACDG